jgi:uncharacterized membrane protein required for colicin V production
MATIERWLSWFAGLLPGMTWLRQFNWLDVVLVLVVLYGIYRGFRAGFIRMILGLAGVALGFWGAATWSPALVAYSENKFRWVTSFSLVTRKYISIPLEVATKPLKDLNPAELVRTVLSLPIPDELKATTARYISNLSMSMGASGASTVGEYLYRALASLCLHAAAFIFLFFLVRGIAALMSEVLTRTLAGGMAGSFINRALGASAGLLQTTIVLVALFGLLAPILNMSAFSLGKTLAESRIVPVLSRTFMWAVARFGGGL